MCLPLYWKLLIRNYRKKIPPTMPSIHHLKSVKKIWE